MPRKSDAHRIYDIVSNKIFTHQALQNYYLTVDRQPYFKQASRKAMVNYEIFQGCMLASTSHEMARLQNELLVLERSKIGSSGGFIRRFQNLQGRKSQSSSSYNRGSLYIEVLNDADVMAQRLQQDVKQQPLVTGFNFPIADEETVELLEATVNSNERIREEYINYLRAKKPKPVGIVTVFQTLFSDESMYSYNYSGICNHGSGRKAMQNYSIFSDCMLEAWRHHGIDTELLRQNLNQVIMKINGRKRNRKYFAKRKVKNRMSQLESGNTC